MTIDILVLDAAPLLSLAPLKDLAKIFVTTPQVLAELRDPRAREHFRKLGNEGVEVLVRTPDVLSYSKVTAAAKKSGDFSVLSQTDMMLLALTVSMKAEHDAHKASITPVAAAPAVEASAEVTSAADPTSAEPTGEETAAQEEEEVPAEVVVEDDSVPDEATEEVNEETPIPELDDLSLTEREPLDSTTPDAPSSESTPKSTEPASSAPIFEDPSDSDDGDGEWITPDNVAKFKAREIFSDPSSRGKAAPPQDLDVACMTADYAMQNVLLHMGLNLVGLEGKRITVVKTWVLRCHGCYALCKDQTKKFCPKCGGATLIRASVSTKAAPAGSSEAAQVQVHLKSNFQYRNRGTVFSIPSPKAGTSKGGAGSKNLVLREDQVEFQRGLKTEAVRVRKEEKKIASALAAAASKDAEGGGVTKNWADPDWMPDMLLGKSSSRRGSALPDIGYGRRNPNAVRKKMK